MPVLRSEDQADPQQQEMVFRRMQDESVPSETPVWIVNRKRIFGSAQTWLKQQGKYEECMQHAAYKKKAYESRTGSPPDKETKRDLMWDAIWQYVDDWMANRSTVVLNDTEPEPEVEPEDELPDLSTFDGKDASMAEAIRWAVEHSYIRGVDPSLAPSKLAWTFYCYGQANRLNMQSLFTSLFPKIMPKAKEDEEGGLSDDGKLIGLLEQVQEMSEELMDE